MQLLPGIGRGRACKCIYQRMRCMRESKRRSGKKILLSTILKPSERLNTHTESHQQIIIITLPINSTTTLLSQWHSLSFKLPRFAAFMFWPHRTFKHALLCFEYVRPYPHLCVLCYVFMLSRGHRWMFYAWYGHQSFALPLNCMRLHVCHAMASDNKSNAFRRLCWWAAPPSHHNIRFVYISVLFPCWRRNCGRCVVDPVPEGTQNIAKLQKKKIGISHTSTLSCVVLPATVDSSRVACCCCWRCATESQLDMQCHSTPFGPPTCRSVACVLVCEDVDNAGFT